MWERFSYYGMRALLILFMTAAPAARAGWASTPSRRRRDLRPLHLDGLHDEPARRLDRRPADRPAPRRPLRRHPDRVRPLQHGRSRRWRRSISGLALIVLGTGLLKGNVSVIVGQLYGRKTISGATPASRSSTWGSTSARSSRRWSAAISGSASAGTSASRPPASAWRSAWFSTCSARKHLGDAGLQPGAGASPAAAAQAAHALAGAASAAACSCWSASALATGVDARHGQRRSPTPPATCCSASRSCFFGWLFLVGDWTPVERKHLYAIGVLFVGIRALLVRVRAGRVDAEPVRRPQHATLESLGWNFPSSWFQSVQRRCSSSPSRRCSPGCGSGSARASRRARPSSHSACCCVGRRLRRAGRRRGDFAANGVKVSPWWLVVDLPASHLRRAVPQPGRPERDDASSRRRASAGSMMGVWFLAISVGNFIGGRIVVALRVDDAAERCSAPSPRSASARASSCCVLAPPIKRLMGDVEL